MARKLNVWARLRIATTLSTLLLIVSPTDLAKSDLTLVPALIFSAVGAGVFFVFTFIVYTLHYASKEPPIRALWDWNGRPFTGLGEAPTWLPLQLGMLGIFMPLRTLVRGGEYDPGAIAFLAIATSQYLAISLAHRMRLRREQAPNEGVS